MCNEIFGYVTRSKNGKEVKERAWFPAGCDGCANEDPEECKTGCLWPKNHEKYTEVKWFYGVYQAQKGGYPLEELDSLGLVEYMKLGILRDYDRAMNPSMN